MADLRLSKRTLPNEIFLCINQFTDYDTLKSIRLVSRLFNDLARIEFYRVITLPSFLTDLHDAIDNLNLKDNARFIRTLVIGSEAIIPRVYLDSDIVCEGNIQEIYYLPQDQEDGMEGILLRSSITFTACLFRIFGECRNFLRKLKIRGYDYTQTRFGEDVLSRFNHDFLDSTTVQCVVQVMACISLPLLRTVILRFQRHDALFQHNALGLDLLRPTLISNLSNVRNLTFKGSDGTAYDYFGCRSTESFLRWQSGLKLEQLKIVIICQLDIPKFPIEYLDSSPLRSLSLEGMIPYGYPGFAPLLTNMRQLRFLSLNDMFFEYSKDPKHHWAAVFYAILGLSRLENIELCNIQYSGGDSRREDFGLVGYCYEHGLCSPIEEDRRSYEKVGELAKRLKSKYGPVKMNTRWTICKKENHNWLLPGNNESPLIF